MAVELVDSMAFTVNIIDSLSSWLQSLVLRVLTSIIIIAAWSSSVFYVPCFFMFSGDLHRDLDIHAPYFCGSSWSFGFHLRDALMHESIVDAVARHPAPRNWDCEFLPFSFAWWIPLPSL
jgi:hypothetical protein